MGSVLGGLGAKAGAMMAVAMFALGFVAMKGHFGPRADGSHAKVELASAAPAAAAPAAPAATTQAPAAADPSPTAGRVDANAAKSIDTSATGAINPDPKKKHKHKHKPDLAKQAKAKTD